MRNTIIIRKRIYFIITTFNIIAAYFPKKYLPLIEEGESFFTISLRYYLIDYSDIFFCCVTFGTKITDKMVGGERFTLGTQGDQRPQKPFHRVRCGRLRVFDFKFIAPIADEDEVIAVNANAE